MAFSEIKKVEEIQVSEPQETDESRLIEETLHQLQTLGDQLAGKRLVSFTYRGKALEVRGIPEDFKILLDGSKVCEFVYDNVHNVDNSLVLEIGQ